MNLDDLLKEMKEKMQKKDLSDEYLEKNGNTTRTEIGIGEYSYGITTIPCEWVYDFLSDYKRVLKENEYMHNELNKQQTTINKYAKENEELKNKIMEKELEIIGKEEYTKASMGEIIEQYYTANEDCITKQRIEDIIDRIDYDIKKTKEIISNDQKNNYQITRLKAMNTKSLDIKKRLQELLESEE